MKMKHKDNSHQVVTDEQHNGTQFMRIWHKTLGNDFANMFLHGGPQRISVKKTQQFLGIYHQLMAAYRTMVS